VKREEQIDLAALETELVQEFARELECDATPCTASPRRNWTDGFRASGAKHAMM
jgi:hypothetical protein